MSSPIVQPVSFTTTKVNISQPKVLESGGKLAYLNYGDARSLTIQTPSLPTPFGLNVFDKNGPPKYSFDLAMRGYKEAGKVKQFFDALTQLDEYMVDQGVKNSKLWFKSDMKREVVQAFYSPVVKFGRDKEGNQTAYPPNVKLQLRRNRNGDGFETEFYDDKSKSNPHAQPLRGIPIEELLVKKSEVTVLMQCTGVWFAGGKFGLSWKALQVRLDSVPAGIHGYGFQEEGESASFAEPAEFAPRQRSAAAPVAQIQDEDEEEDEETVPAPSASASHAAAAADEEEDEEEVAPAPVPKKTVVTKKKVVTGLKAAAK
jgi:hypothetical protein